MADHDLTSPDCKRVSTILARVGDKWSVLVVMLLGDGPRRFNEIKHMVNGISQRMLTLTLRALERDGLVTRTVYATVPPKVEYQLTALGRSLRDPVHHLGMWVVENAGGIDAARAAYDARTDQSDADAKVIVHRMAQQRRAP